MDELYTINQAALTLKVHQLTIRRYIKQGKLKAVRVGGNVRVPLNELRAFMQDLAPVEKQTKSPVSIGGKAFSVDDPFLALKGRGLSIGRGERE